MRELEMCREVTLQSEKGNSRQFNQINIVKIGSRSCLGLGMTLYVTLDDCGAGDHS